MSPRRELPSYSTYSALWGRICRLVGWVGEVVRVHRLGQDRFPSAAILPEVALDSALYHSCGNAGKTRTGSIRELSTHDVCLHPHELEPHGLAGSPATWIHMAFPTAVLTHPAGFHPHAAVSALDRIHLDPLLPTLPFLSKEISLLLRHRIQRISISIQVEQPLCRAVFRASCYRKRRMPCVCARTSSRFPVGRMLTSQTVVRGCS